MLFSRGFVRYTSAAMSRKSLPRLGARWRPARLRSASMVVTLGLVFGCSVPQGKVRLPESAAARLSQTGIASWYGPGFHGKATASGAIYDQNDFTAAHQTLPLGTHVRVTNLENGSSIEVLINDRGPFAKGRIIDLSHSAAHKIDMIGPGTARVRLDVLASPVKLSRIPEAIDYTLQLGSFTRMENARELRDRAARSFPQVAITPLQLRDGTFFRVHLGTFSSRDEAEEHARLLAQTGFPAIIMEK